MRQDEYPGMVVRQKAPLNLEGPVFERADLAYAYAPILRPRPSPTPQL